MSIICPEAKLVFFPIPKVACTSVKATLYENINAVVWPHAGIGMGQVHGFPGYRSLPFPTKLPEIAERFAKVAVIRNPIDRAISAYRDKARNLVLKGSKFEEKLLEAGLPLEPDPELFFSEIDQYFECAALIKEHMRPFNYHLGKDIEYYDKIFKLEDIGDFGTYMSERLGRPAQVKRSNSSQKSVNTVKPISEKTLTKIADFCSDDLTYLADYYSV